MLPRFIRKLFSSQPRPAVDHPVLGKLQLNDGANGPYWLREAFREGEMTVSVETVAGELPSEAQVHFYERVIGDMEATYGLVQTELSAEHEKMHSKPVAANWRETFRLAGVGVPLSGDPQNPWDVTFECLTDRTMYLYTCYFEHGSLAHVSIDT